MPNRRILSVWFPRLGAERLIRCDPLLTDLPLAVVRDTGQMQVVSSLSVAASQRGLYVGQPVRDAHAMCADLISKLSNPQQELAFLGTLHRWAGKYSPWVARENPDALVIDLTGCAHLFGGEQSMLDQLDQDCGDLGLTVQCGIADTVGAAWALARYAGQAATSDRSGDAIDQEARATRSRAGKRRHWERGGALPGISQPIANIGRISEPGKAYSALAPLPIAALRLEPHVAEGLIRLGLRKVSDVIGQPRAGLARRFGRGLVMRLDQAMGAAPEPVAPAKPPDRFATRMTLPEPIGLIDDLIAGIDRMLPRLCKLLENKGKGARTLRFEAYRTDDTMQWITTSLARPSHIPDRLRPLLVMKLEDIDAGFGIDMLRIEAVVTEPVHARTMAGHAEATQQSQRRLKDGARMDDLIGRLGARIGMDQITRRHPASSHIPEKTSQILAAAWSEPAKEWPEHHLPRPLLLWHPEPVNAPTRPKMPDQFRWRGRTLRPTAASGPERIAPEWWLDDPSWRSGHRDYWHVTTDQGDRLWLFYAHGASMSPGWFCHGSFA